jgi:hypothetical protein
VVGFDDVRYATLLSVSLTLITLGEYHFGIRDSAFRRDLERWLDAFLGGAEVLSPNLQTLPFYADVRMDW